jgi:hypothetical protein
MFLPMKRKREEEFYLYYEKESGLIQEHYVSLSDNKFIPFIGGFDDRYILDNICVESDEIILALVKNNIFEGMIYSKIKIFSDDLKSDFHEFSIKNKQFKWCFKARLLEYSGYEPNKILIKDLEIIIEYPKINFMHDIKFLFL